MAKRNSGSQRQSKQSNKPEAKNTKETVSKTLRLKILVLKLNIEGIMISITKALTSITDKSSRNNNTQFIF